MNASVGIVAPAKINLYLHVLGRRADGYHDLDSLIVFADLHDTVTVAPSDSLSLTVEGPFAAALTEDLTIGENLVLRAARLLAEHLGRSPAVAIRLEKKIPIAAGLGGGSADTAAVLLALCHAWRAEIAPPILADMALRLGADVPICLMSQPAFVSGVGERLQAAPALPALHLVLVNPRVALSTAAVFAGRDGPFSARPRPSFAPRDTPSLVAALRDCRNDLTAAAVGRAPVIGEVLAAIESVPDVLLARMSGSGATCFGLLTDDSAAQAAARHIAASRPDWWVTAGRLIDGREALPVVGVG